MSDNYSIQQYAADLRGIAAENDNEDEILRRVGPLARRFANDRGKDLYHFWGDRIADRLNYDLSSLGSNTVVNLASVEYFKSVNTTALNAEIVSPVFRDLKNGTYKIISPRAFLA